MIPHSRPWITAEDLDAVAAVLQGEMIGQGAVTARFETAMSHRLGISRPGVAVGSGSAALQLALLATGVGSGDEVVVPTYMCRSALEVVRSTGATAVLADVGPTFVVTPSTVAPLLGSRTRALVVPHIYGIFADVEAFRPLGIPIVEDCAQAVGGPEPWRLAGDIGVFSFQPAKCLTTGEGGLAVSNNAGLLRRLRELRDGGASGRAVFAPLPDTAAALGLSQLQRYDAALARRRWIAETYRSALGERAGWLLRRTPWQRTMHFRFPVSCPGGLDAAQADFARHDIMVRRGVDELLHRVVGLPDRAFPVATELFETTVSIPIYPAMSDAGVALCAGALETWAARTSYQSTLM